jgi:hypothetical protein
MRAWGELGGFTRFAASTFAAGALLLAIPRDARADALTVDESSRLARGETVSRLQTIDRDERRYVGGVTYTVIDSTPEEMASLLDDVASYRQMLPKTKSARLVGTKSGDAFIELRQGNDLFETSYTVRVHRETSLGVGGGGASTVRFWLDPSRPHGIDDAWGFFRVEALPEAGKVLLTYGVLVDMGGGIGRLLFEEKVRGLMLTVPQLVRGYLARRHARTPWRVTQR